MLGLEVWAKNTRQVVHPLQHIIPGLMTLTKLITGDVNLNNLVKVMFAKFLHYKVTVFSLHIFFFERSHYALHTFKERESFRFYFCRLKENCLHRTSICLSICLSSIYPYYWPNPPINTALK